MNAGLSNLATLKAHVLGASASTSTQFDTVLTALGLGLAAHIANLLQRDLGRVTGDRVTIPADRVHLLLPRYPVESVTKIELKHNEADGWVEQTINDFVTTIDTDNGIIFLPDSADPGRYSSLIRVTYTGGYWWEEAEPTDVGYPTTQPTGSTALPKDISTAWLLTCQDVWAKRDKLGLSLVDAPDAQAKVGQLQISPMVKAMLADYIRTDLV